MDSNFEIEELDVWKPYVKSHFLDVLNGEYDLEKAREELIGFRNTKYYTGTNNDFKIPEIAPATTELKKS